MIRSTTSGVLKSYRFNLQRSTYNLNKSRDTVLTGRKFNSYAEDPATAARSFKLRSSLAHSDSQISINESVTRKYEVAWSTISGVTEQVNAAKSAIVAGGNDPTGHGRNALGQELVELADGMAQAMNAKYGDNFVFAGADGKNAPFAWDEDHNLMFRGQPVDTAAPEQPPQGDDAIRQQEALDALHYMAEGEHKFVDIGLGLQETEDGLNESSVFDASLQGINFLGYGVDEDGDPRNIISLTRELGLLLQSAGEDGSFTDAQQADYDRLLGKFDDAAHTLNNQYTKLDTEAAFLKSNQKQLETNATVLTEQIGALENVDPAEAITAYSWAQYCYNAALKVGNSILSQSLMDYMNT